MCEKPHRKVPIKFDGFTIGSAFVSSDGQIIIARIDTSNVGEEIRERLLSDTLDHISINPRK
jgi:hypothetical protein